MKKIHIRTVKSYCIILIYILTSYSRWCFLVMVMEYAMVKTKVIFQNVMAALSNIFLRMNNLKWTTKQKTKNSKNLMTILFTLLMKYKNVMEISVTLMHICSITNINLLDQ